MDDDDLPEVLTVAEALAAGLTRDQLRSARFEHPAVGVVAVYAERDAVAQRAMELQAIAVACAPDQFLCSVTAARLHGLPMPRRLDDGVVHVASPSSRNRMRRGARTTADPSTGLVSEHGVRVQGHRFKATVEEIDGYRVESLEDTIIHLAFELSLDELVAVCDAAVHRGRAERTSVAAIADRAREFTGSKGLPLLRSALIHAREGADSPGETKTRMLIVRDGMPEPVLQHEVRDTFGRLVHVDLAWPELRIAIEYEGDHHRTDDGQWTYDIRRYRALEAAGWLVIRVTRHDLHAGGETLLRELRAARARRVPMAS